jgi:hypothetical protein
VCGPRARTYGTVGRPRPLWSRLPRCAGPFSSARASRSTSCCLSIELEWQRWRRAHSHTADWVAATPRVAPLEHPIGHGLVIVDVQFRDPPNLWGHSMALFCALAAALTGNGPSRDDHPALPDTAMPGIRGEGRRQCANICLRPGRPNGGTVRSVLLQPHGRALGVKLLSVPARSESSWVPWGPLVAGLPRAPRSG